MLEDVSKASFAKGTFNKLEGKKVYVKNEEMKNKVKQVIALGAKESISENDIIVSK